MNALCPSPLKKYFPYTCGEWGLLLLVFLYVSGGALVSHLYGLSNQFRALLYLNTGVILTRFFILGYIILWCLWALKTILVERPVNLRQRLWDNLKQGALNRERYIRALPVFIAFLFFFSSFSSLKFMIPGIHPFSWDEKFSVLDRIVHGGIDPWRLLHPLLGYWPVTLFINFIYNFWLLILYLVLYAALLSLRNPALRMRFFYCFILTWILNGTVLADRKSTRLNSSHTDISRMPSSA